MRKFKSPFVINLQQSEGHQRNLMLGYLEVSLITLFYGVSFVYCILEQPMYDNKQHWCDRSMILSVICKPSSVCTGYSWFCSLFDLGICIIMPVVWPHTSWITVYFLIYMPPPSDKRHGLKRSKCYLPVTTAIKQCHTMYKWRRGKTFSLTVTIAK